MKKKERSNVEKIVLMLFKSLLDIFSIKPEWFTRDTVFI